MRLVKEECKYQPYGFSLIDTRGIVDISMSDVISGKNTTGFIYIFREYTHGGRTLQATSPPMDLYHLEYTLNSIREMRKKMRLKTKEKFKEIFEREYLDALYEISEIFLASKPKSEEWDRFSVLSGRIRELERLLFKTDALFIRTF